jgi:hypothetical protein
VACPDWEHVQITMDHVGHEHHIRVDAMPVKKKDKIDE